MTDHRELTETTHMEDGMLVLSGIEMDYNIPGEVIHIVGIGASEDIMKTDLSRDPQLYIDTVSKLGGRTILAHPAWSLNSITTLAGLHGISAAEIYNSASTYPWNGDRADSSNVLDVAAAHGTFYHFVASDDSHWYDGEAGRSFTMIQADELTQKSLFEAFDAGRFYCSQGPEFKQIQVDENQISVECSPVERIIFYSNRPWAKDRCINGSDITRASYDRTIHQGDTFIRIQLMDKEGRSAWSNPITF